MTAPWTSSYALLNPKLGCCRLSAFSGLCGLCAKALKWLPVLIISAFLVWSYLPLRGAPLPPHHQVRHNEVHAKGLFRVLFRLFLWSYLQTVWSHPGKVP